ncbi:MAG: hypothetical protein KDA36_09085 [Planctomycetaceae bacterium]|nr:hypothetical protein [Planctomycetaceae bacterium]
MSNQISPKPAGTVIEEIDELDGSRIYRWQPYKRSVFLYFPAIFLSIWMCGWAVALIAAVRELITNAKGEERMFLILWLALWSIGGIMAGTILYFMFRPGRHESVRLGRFQFRHDPGSIPMGVLMSPAYAFKNLNAMNPFFPFNQMFSNRKPIELDKQQLGPVKLERVGERQRLYFDHGSDRIEIGENLREPEREWLAAVIQNWQDG